MSFTEKYTKVFRALLPAPFTIAVVLTFITFFLALFLTKPGEIQYGSYALDLLSHWESGLGGEGGLAFALQMMLMLVLGHVLALSKPIDSLLRGMVGFCNTTASAAFFVTLFTLMFSFVNWGLGLIFGALFARKVAERSILKGFSINYPLVGAAGYAGLMVWHGGLSGSAPLKIAEANGMKTLLEGYELPEGIAANLPQNVSFSETVFSPMNITVSILLLICIPLLMLLIGKFVKPASVNISAAKQQALLKDDKKKIGAEKLDYSAILCVVTGAAVLAYAASKIVLMEGEWSWNFINPNYINLVLFGLCLVFHFRFAGFLRAIEKAIGGSAGILIQFPLYFGILGLMKGSGLMSDISNFFVAYSSENTHPIFTFFSAGLVNILVPSGGGQWAVQGPIIIESSMQQGLPLGKGIMAMAYGDQLTNMLQPFWALPLLGITGLKAKEILPYTLLIMLLGAAIFIAGLLLF